MEPVPQHPLADDAMVRHVFAAQHGRWLQERRAQDPNFNHFAEPPVKKIRWFDEWLDVHFKIIQRLVEEPMFAQPHIGEPALEVNIISAELWGPWPHPFLNALTQPFVRHYIDTEMVAETKPWGEDNDPNKDPRTPMWNEKFLVLPRGAKVSQFEVLNNMNMPLVLGDAAYNTETLWKCAQDCGRFMLDIPILYTGREVGRLRVRFRMWDGMPLEEENPHLAGLGGTLAGALDNDFMREFGPSGVREAEATPFPNAGLMLANSSMPNSYNNMMNPMMGSYNSGMCIAPNVYM
jgi:hypothetical protein